MLGPSVLAWMIAGLAAGAAHASALWRTTRRPTAWTPLVGAVRVAAVAAVLALAALWGEILSAAAGWAVGFAVLGTWLVWRRAV